MRIGIEVQRLLRKKKHGMEIVALELIRQLQLIDTKNQYFIFAKDDEDKECIQETKNFQVVLLSGISYVDWEQIQLPKAVKKYKLDILHCTCNTAPLNLSVPLVLTLHDIIYLESISFSGTSYQNFGNLYRRWLIPQILKNCQKVITVSNYEEQRITKALNIKTPVIETVYNAVSNNFKLISEDLLIDYQQKYQLPNKFILYFANPAPKKNVLNTLLAYQFYLKNTKEPLPLVLTDTNRKYINQLLKKLNLKYLSKLIKVIDFIPFSDLPYVYNLATLYLYTSKRESFGLPILEAMACGTPVITSNTSSMPEVAQDAALLADPHDYRSIGNQIAALLSDKSQYRTLVEKGLMRAEKFTWEHTALQVMKIYQRAVAGEDTKNFTRKNTSNKQKVDV